MMMNYENKFLSTKIKIKWKKKDFLFNLDEKKYN